MISRRALLSATVAVIVVSAVPTGGFSASEAVRGFDAAVVDDDRAYLGVDTIDQSLQAGATRDVTVVELENRLDQPLADVAVSIDGDGQPPPVSNGPDAPSDLDVGERASVTATVDCDTAAGTAETESWWISVAASGEDVSVELTRRVTVSCESSTPDPAANQTTTAATETVSPG